MEFICQKQTGDGAASTKEIKEFNNYCEKNNAKVVKICVTDEEHELLSLDANTPFISSENGRLYNTVMEGYNEIILENTIVQFDTIPITKYNREIMTTLILDKFNNNIEAKQILMSTSNYDIICYKTNDDNYWGSRVPEFDGQNIAGQLMVELRNYYKSI